MRGMRAIGAVWLSLMLGGAAAAQTNAPAAAPPPTEAAPLPGSLGRGVVPPPRNVDPAMVTPPPDQEKPSMPVIKPPVNAR